VKKAFIVSGIIAVVLLALLLSGFAGEGDAVKNALKLGNKEYEAGKYAEALNYYGAALIEYPDNEELNFNTAQAAYMLGEYGLAAACYEKSPDSREKYLNFGNSCYRLGEASEAPDETMGAYAQALNIYEEGIVKYPQDVPLKFNYEFVKRKIEELAQEMEQDSEGEEGDGEQSEGEEGEQGESGEGEEGDQEEAEEGEQSEAEEGAGDDEDIDAGQDGEYGESNPDQEAIDRILELLEAQEEESLKNNQEVTPGKDGGNAW